MGNSKDKSSTTWRREDEATLVQILKQQKASGNWGDNNPKKVAWTACETALAGSEVMSGGAPKTLVSIKNRWQRVQFVSSNLLCII
jgi:hypothetical protein